MEKAMKKSGVNKIKSNLIGHSNYNFDCKYCGITQDEDIQNPKKRKSVWALCDKCALWMHVNCMPRKIKIKHPGLLKRISSGDKLSFICC